VTVVAENPETIDGLQGYLQGAGVACHATRSMGDESTVPAVSTSLVLFPDDYDVHGATDWILLLRRSRPQLRILLVSNQPQRFQDATVAIGRSVPPVVLPKPAFGWTILDAVRDGARGGKP
jgi:hypothetical protein